MNALTVSKQIGKISSFVNMLLYPFVQFEKEFKQKSITVSSYIGGLRQVLTSDSGVYCASKEPPVGTVIRDDSICKVTVTELQFVLSLLN